MDDFLDFIFSFLIVPLGGVEFLLGGNTGLKNIDNLYESVSNGIDEKYFVTPEIKRRLMNPKLPYGYRSENQFLPVSEDSPPFLHYINNNLGTLPILCYDEKNPFDEYDDVRSVSSFKSSKEFYVKKQAMCFVKDDLSVCPSLTTSISILDGFGIPLSDVKDV